LTLARPSGEAITVRLPFNRTTERVSAASFLAWPTRSAWTSREEVPASLANSPAWGVRTASDFRSASSAVNPTKAFSPSASNTTGTGLDLTSVRT